jgi:hypothetical protein
VALQPFEWAANAANKVFLSIPYTNGDTDHVKVTIYFIVVFQGCRLAVG